jgi:hypothetical protein
LRNHGHARGNAQSHRGKGHGRQGTRHGPRGHEGAGLRGTASGTQGRARRRGGAGELPGTGPWASGAAGRGREAAGERGRRARASHPGGVRGCGAVGERGHRARASRRGGRAGAGLGARGRRRGTGHHREGRGRGAAGGCRGRVTEPARGARQGYRGRAGKKKGEGEGKRERERGGELTSGSKSGDQRLQNLGHHHGERERWERERLLRGRNQMKERDQGSGARAWGAGGTRGARTELGWAGPHREPKPHGTHYHTSKNQCAKQNPRQN